jgi:hypothetical protein
MKFIPGQLPESPDSKLTQLTINSYSEDEKRLLLKLESLFRDWYDFFKTFEQPVTGIFNEYFAESMCFDGFYPGYLKAKTRIMFIGRESIGLSGENYTENLYNAYSENSISDKSLNQSLFHRRIFYLVWSILNGEADYPSVPYAKDMLNDFQSGKLGFSLINLSKFSNEEGKYNACWPLINKSVELSTKGRNLIREEIEILNPDLIFSMNLEPYLKFFGELTPLHSDAISSSEIKAYKLMVAGRNVLLLDTFHFSAVMKEKETFFDPIVKTLKSVAPDLGLNLYNTSK